MKEEGVSIAPFPAILFDPSTNQRASCGFVSSQSPSDNGLKPRSFPSPPSRGPWRARLSSTVRVQIHPISYEPIQTNVATPSMRRVRRKTSETIGSTHPKKKTAGKKEIETENEHPPYPQRKTKVPAELRRKLRLPLRVRQFSEAVVRRSRSANHRTARQVAGATWTVEDPSFAWSRSSPATRRPLRHIHPHLRVPQRIRPWPRRLVATNVECRS